MKKLIQLCLAVIGSLALLSHAESEPIPDKIYLSEALPVTDLQSVSNDQQIILSWIGHNEGQETVLILKSDTYLQSNPINGYRYVVGQYIDSAEVVYIGTQSPFMSSELLRNTEYFYQVFTFYNNPDYDYYYVYPELLIYSSPVYSWATTTDIGNSAPYIQLNRSLPHYVQLTLADIDLTDTHSILWTVSPEVLNQSDDPYLFDVGHLNYGVYTLTVTVTDSGTPSLSSTETMMLYYDEPEVYNSSLGSFNIAFLMFMLSLALLSVSHVKRKLNDIGCRILLGG